MNRDLSLVAALSLEIPSRQLLDRLGERVLQQTPPLQPNANQANAPNPVRGYGVNGPAVNAGERNLIQVSSDNEDDEDDEDDQTDPTGGTQDVKQPENGTNEFQDVGEDAKAPKGQDMEEKLP